MTRPPLRLVLDAGDHPIPATLELPPGAADIHVHLHIGAPDRHEPPPAAAVQGRSEPGYWRLLLLGGACAAIGIVAFDMGARTGEGHALALAVPRGSASGLASLLPGPKGPPAQPASSELPASVRQQLAQRPTIIPPLPATQQPPDGSNPFGLHP